MSKIKIEARIYKLEFNCSSKHTNETSEIQKKTTHSPSAARLQ